MDMINSMHLRMLETVKYAIYSGVCASSASIFGKISGLPIFEGNFTFRIPFFICMLVCNGGVWTFFVKALQLTNSLSATVISSATNYVISAVAGFLIFGEFTSLWWWSGMFLIILGVLLIVADESKKEVKSSDDPRRL
ncbi:unnamed protein product [Phaedon cochleariae]|uniref:EamA domain-containing protein n=1 Tax=Phaedon cochleariae TaxID=80249 RepID=A0A9P0GS14_PHACE|nr:unnamed protein product [Phaedon cochleariae]